MLTYLPAFRGLFGMSLLAVLAVLAVLVCYYLYNLHFRFFSSSETKKWKIAGKVPPPKKYKKNMIRT